MTTRNSTNADTTAESNTILETTDLEAAYGPTQVLHGISLSVNEGEVVSLIGRNGAGKTTTLNSVVGNVDITGGQVTFEGDDITSLPPDDTVNRGLALVPEERRIFGNLTVRENLKMGTFGGGDGADARNVDEVLDMFENLKRNEHSLGSQMSGGEQQMLAVGRALVSDTDLLMLDEPTEGLAPFIVEQVEETITELNEQGVTVLLVEQNAEVALNVADRHYILDKGEVVYEGDTDDLEADDDVLDRYLGVTV